MNAFISLARARYSVRKFKDAPISAESLHRILVAGQLAPTACNNQAVHVYVLESADARAKVAGIDEIMVLMRLSFSVSARRRTAPGKSAGGRDHERGTGCGHRCHTHDAGGWRKGSVPAGWVIFRHRSWQKYWALRRITSLCS